MVVILRREQLVDLLCEMLVDLLRILSQRVLCKRWQVLQHLLRCGNSLVCFGPGMGIAACSRVLDVDCEPAVENKSVTLNENRSIPMSSFLQTLLSMAAVCMWGMTGVAQAQNSPPAPSDTPSPPSMAANPTMGTPSSTPRTNSTPSTTGAGAPGTSDSTSADYRSGSDNTTRGSRTTPGVPGTTPSDNNYNQGNGMNNGSIRQPRGDRN